MTRNVFGAMIVAGGLALWTSVAGFADFTPATAKAAIATCAATVVLTDPATLSAQAATEARALNAETTVGLAEITAEANSSIDELAAEKVDEDGAKDARAINAQLTAVVDEACQSIANLKSEYAAAITELKAESTQPNVEKQDGNQQEVDQAEKPEVENEKPEVRSTSREGND